VLEVVRATGCEPYALYLDLGQGEPAEDVKAKALKIGAADAFVRDAKAEFAEEYVAPAIKANALYGGKYPLLPLSGVLLSRRSLSKWHGRSEQRTSRTARPVKATTRSDSTLRPPR
jgi:argininosuccinate synthase